MTPITNQDKSHAAPCNSFYGCILKAHLPIYHQFDTCTLGMKDSAKIEIDDSPSKFQVNQDVWVKVDPNTKWMAGKITQILPNQSYMTELTDGHVFHRNQHHITKWQGCLKPIADSQADSDSQSYNLRQRKSVKSVKWPDFPIVSKQGTTDFDLPNDL